MQNIRLYLGLLIVGLAMNAGRCDAADWFSSLEPSCSVQSPGCQENADCCAGGSFVERQSCLDRYTATHKGNPSQSGRTRAAGGILLLSPEEEINELGDGGFDLVEPSRMQDVCRPYSLAQIQRKSIRQPIAEQAGDADVLVIPVVTNSGSSAKKFDWKCILVDVGSNDEEF